MVNGDSLRQACTKVITATSYTIGDNDSARIVMCRKVLRKEMKVDGSV